jgi:hypothetical protein
MLDIKFLEENGFLDDNTGKISLADKLEGKTKQYVHSMKLLINQDYRKPLTVGQVIEFLQKLDPEEDILIHHNERIMGVAAPLTEILVPEGRTTPEFISLYARDQMNKKQE